MGNFSKVLSPKLKAVDEQLLEICGEVLDIFVSPISYFKAKKLGMFKAVG